MHVNRYTPLLKQLYIVPLAILLPLKTIISSNPWIFFFCLPEHFDRQGNKQKHHLPKSPINWIFSFAQHTMCNSTQHTCDSAFRQISSKKTLKYSSHKQPKQGSSFRKCMGVKQYFFNLIRDIAATSTDLRRQFLGTLFGSKVQIATVLVCTGVLFGFDSRNKMERPSTCLDRQDGKYRRNIAEVKGDQTEENWTQIGKGRNYCQDSHQTPHVKKIRKLGRSFCGLLQLS